MTDVTRVAVVTGANRGLGYYTCRELVKRGLTVVLTSRDEAKGAVAVETLKAEGVDVVFHQLDVTDCTGIARLEAFLREECGRIDVLVNNAGVFLEGGISNETPLSLDFFASSFDVSVDTIRRTMETNVYGPFHLTQTLIPLMKENGYGRIVNVSSQSGQFTGPTFIGGDPGYRMSKVAINVLTVCFANELKESNILVSSVDPGWLRTDIGGGKNKLTPGEAVDTLVWLATLPDDGPTGGFFRKRERIPW